MTTTGKRRRTSSIRLEGIAATLSTVQVRVIDEVRENLLSRREAQFHALPDEEIEAQAHIAGKLAKSATADAVAIAFQRGVQRKLMAEGEWPTEQVRKDVVEGLVLKLTERRSLGRNELSNEEIEAQARHAGLIAKEASAEPIGESHMLGVDHDAAPDAHVRQTTPVPGGSSKP